MPDMQAQMEAVASFSEGYREEFLDEPPVDLGPEEDPFQVRLLLMKIFASARSETTSIQYRKRTETVLREHEQSIRARWDGSEDGITDAELDQQLADEGVGNQHDRQMVVETLDYLGTLDEQGHDVIAYTTDAIPKGEIETVYEELTDIHNIGPKKATLYLRDVVTHWNLEEHLDGKQYRYVFPIDTWVFRAADEIGIVSTDSLSWVTNSTEIVEACGEDVSPIAFNQGAWYLGANAFSVLIEHLAQLK